jgi:hypothetical protein
MYSPPAPLSKERGKSPFSLERRDLGMSTRKRHGYAPQAGLSMTVAVFINYFVTNMYPHKKINYNTKLA